MIAEKDKIINRIFWLGILIVLIIWLIQGGPAMVPEGDVVDESKGFVAKYFHFLIMAYVFISIQAAGFLEMKKGKHFMPAFFLTLILTPVGSYLYYWIKGRIKS